MAQINQSMEANSNMPRHISGHQDGKFAFKFISEERVNYITQMVHYDKKKKLEDEAWSNFIARKNNSKVKHINEKPLEPSSHLEVTSVLETKQNEVTQSVEIQSSPHLSRSESKDGDSGERYWDHSATNLHDVEVVDTIPSNGATNTRPTLKHHSANYTHTLDYFVVHEDPIQERLLHEINDAICTINQAGLEELKSLWLKILLHLEGILSLYVKAPEQENSEEYLLHQLRAAEFTTLFSRNYVYSLRRKLQELRELVDVSTVAHQNTRNANKLQFSLVAAHQAASKALIIYLKRMPCPVSVGVPDKLSELLNLIIDMCAVCRLFGIEPAELKKGPYEVEHKCKYILIQIQDQKTQCQISIDEKHNKILSMDNKKISSQNHKKKLKPYSLAMYKSKVTQQSKVTRTIPNGYKNEIKNLAKVKFGPPPKRHFEAQELKPMTIEHKVKRLHTDVTSPRRVQRTVKAEKPHRPIRPSHDNTEWVGKFDDRDNIQTLVELFGQKEVTSHPEETYMPYADKRMSEYEVNQTNETKGENPDVAKGDSVMSKLISENANVSKQQAVKLGAPNAQLILLPPYQLSSFEDSKQLRDDQYQASRQDNARQGAWQQRHSEPQIASPKTVSMLNRNSEHVKHEDRFGRCASLTTSHKYKVRETSNHNRVQIPQAECFQAPPPCILSDPHLISSQDRISDNANASISYLKTSHANMNEQMSDLQNQQQDVIGADSKLPQTLLGEKSHSKHDSVLLETNNSAGANIHEIKPTKASRQDNARQGAWQQRRSEPQIASPKTVWMLNRNSEQVKHEDRIGRCASLTTSHKYKVRETSNHNRVQISQAECFQASPPCILSDPRLISGQARISDNANASISYLKTSHANMNEQISDLQNQQQDVIGGDSKLPQTLLGEKSHTKHDSVLLETNNSAGANIHEIKPTTLRLSDHQLSVAFEYAHQCENVLKTSLIHKQQLKPWRVLNMLSNQLVDSALKGVVAELDFDALLSNMYGLEFQ